MGCVAGNIFMFLLAGHEVRSFSIISLSGAQLDPSDRRLRIHSRSHLRCLRSIRRYRKCCSSISRRYLETVGSRCVVDVFNRIQVIVVIWHVFVDVRGYERSHLRRSVSVVINSLWWASTYEDYTHSVLYETLRLYPVVSLFESSCFMSSC